jgi:hypothetical protein
VHGVQFASVTAQRVQADVRGDAVQPGPQVLTIEAVPRTPGPQQRLLHHVLGLGERTHHPVAVDVQFTLVALDEMLKRLHKP